jgi:PhnB protein
MPTVNPIPAGYHTLTPYLRVRGGKAAIDFYKNAFGARELMCMTSPKDPARVMHAELMVGDSHLMLGDEYPEMKALSPASIGATGGGVFLYVEDVDAVYARAVELGARPDMPPQNMFWGDRYAKLTDPFGHEWALATHVEDVSKEEIDRRAAKLFG